MQTNDCPRNWSNLLWMNRRLFVRQGQEAQRRRWHPTPVLLPGKSHEQRSLVGYSPWGRKESEGFAKSRTRLSNFTFTFHFHALEKEMATHSSVLAWENPRDGGAWWAAVYGVAQSRTGLKRLSSSSSSRELYSYDVKSVPQE